MAECPIKPGGGRRSAPRKMGCFEKNITPGAGRMGSHRGHYIFRWKWANVTRAAVLRPTNAGRLGYSPALEDITSRPAPGSSQRRANTAESQHGEQRAPTKPEGGIYVHAEWTLPLVTLYVLSRRPHPSLKMETEIYRGCHSRKRDEGGGSRNVHRNVPARLRAPRDCVFKAVLPVQ